MSEVPKNLLYFCAGYNFCFAVFHGFFWKIFRWKADLRALTPINRAIMQVLNLRLIYVFAGFGVMAFLLAGRPVLGSFEKCLLLFISVFWLMRAVEQIVFFNSRKPVSWAFFAVFLTGSAVHFLAAV